VGADDVLWAGGAPSIEDGQRVSDVAASDGDGAGAMCVPGVVREQERAMAGKPLRIGEILVERGVMTDGQVEQVLAKQSRVGKAFGALAEEIFGVPAAEVETAWLEQYASITERLDLTLISPSEEAVALVTVRQAWQFRVIGVRVNHTGLRELTLATAPKYLQKAMRFATHVLDRPTEVVLCGERALAQALARHYPLGGFEMRGENLLRAG
jgi:hypothetical protein